MEKFRLNNLNYIFILSPVLFLFVYVSVLFLDSYFMFAVTTIDPSISFSSLLQTNLRWSFFVYQAFGLVFCFFFVINRTISFTSLSWLQAIVVSTTVSSFLQIILVLESFFFVFPAAFVFIVVVVVVVLLGLAPNDYSGIIPLFSSSV